MWDIKLVDMNGNGIVTGINTTYQTLADVEIFVESTINQLLGVHSVRLVHTEDLIYGVWLNGHEIGVVVIKDVNPAPIKRK